MSVEKGKPKVSYVVTPADLVSHRIHVSAEVQEITPGTDSVDFVMPVWTPGSYEIREYSRNVRGCTARTPAGEPLSVTKIAKNRWRVPCGGSQALIFSYTVYGHELSTQGLDVTPEHIYMNGAHVFCYLDGSLESPSEVTLNPPPGWKVFTELTEVEKNPPHYRAKNFDELVDSPIEIGNPAEFTIRPGGIPHRIIFCGSGGNFTAHRVEEDLTKMVEATRKIFGMLPVTHYTFFFHLADKWDGGLEHATSTSIVLPHHIFRPNKSYEEFLDVACHEYFHLFNVKRIRPAVLGPFDYSKENYTRLLWAMEGTTDYYTFLLLRRAGLLTPKRYLEIIGKHIKRYKETPGRLVQSLEESSFDSWIDLYHPYEESRNSSISYYLKGELVSMCLDLEIRGKSGNAKSLDDVMRHLWKEFGARDLGMSEDAYLKEAQKATGLDLSEFFRNYVSGTTEVDFPLYFGHAGLDLVSEDKEAAKDDEDEKPAYMGIDTEKVDGTLRITVVVEGSPANRAGLTAGDELVAIDGTRITLNTLVDTLKRYEPGDAVEVTYFRRARIGKLSVTLGKAPPEKWMIRPKATPTDEQKRLLESWLETLWDGISK
jgi:predicted metalloprotease with PDZ domain